jgi:CheY-like chemotaxis protein
MIGQPESAMPPGSRVLLVEDEAIISMFFAELLREFVCHVVGPAASVSKAIGFATTEALDGAILDVNVNGETVYAVAQILADRGIPFAFVTGFGGWISETFRGRPTLQKPVDEDKLRGMLTAMMSKAA